MIIYSILLFTLFFVLLRYVKTFQIEGIPKSYLPISFALKTTIGTSFLLIYTYHYGNGNLSADAEQFIRESKVLNDVFYKSPTDYIKFLLGFNNSESIILYYLEETSHWDAGSQTILNDNRNILRFHSLIHFLSFNNVYIHMIVTCFITVFSIKNFFYGLQKYTRLKKEHLFWLLVLLPSVLFWTSSVLKEPLMILGLSFSFRAIMEEKWSKSKVLLGLTGLIILLGFKPYILIIFILSILVYLIYTVIPFKNSITKISFILLFTISIPLIFKKTTLKATEYLTRKQYDFVNISKGGIHVNADSLFYFFKPDNYSFIKVENDSVEVIKDVHAEILHHGSIDPPIPILIKASPKKWKIYFQRSYSTGYIETTPIKNSPLQLVKNIPQALSNALLRPYINDPGSWLKFPAILETLCLIFLLLYSIKNRRSLSSKEKNIILSISVFVLLLSLLIGWTTPVLGAIVRYRIPAYLGILFIALIIYSPSKSSK